jgi:hypothetical protein
MRWTTWIVALALSACSPKGASHDGARRTTLSLADPDTAPQLVSGFHTIEEGAWRWTKLKFAADVARPEASKHGILVILHGSVAAPVIERYGSQTLECSAGGHGLEPEKLTKAGSFIYARELEGVDVPVFRIACSVDHAVPTTNDDRELGLIISTIALLPR